MDSNTHMCKPQKYNLLPSTPFLRFNVDHIIKTQGKKLLYK